MIGRFLVAWAASQADLAALITGANGLKVSPFANSQGTAFPRVVYERVAETRVGSLTGPRNLWRSLYQIEAHSLDPDEAETIADMIVGNPDRGDRRLDGYKGTIGHIEVQGCHLENRLSLYDTPVDGSDNGIHREILNLIFWWARV